MQRAKNQFVGKLTEAKIPPLSPELRERRRAERRRHDGLRVNTQPPPHKSNQLERPEMQQQDQTQHARPPSQQWFSGGQRSRHNPHKYRAKGRFERRPKPRHKSRRRNVLLRIQKCVRIHPRPCEQISHGTPGRMRNLGPRPPPRQPLEAEKDGERQRPHEHPRRQPIAARNCRQRQHPERKPANPPRALPPHRRFDLSLLALRQGCHLLPDRRTSYTVGSASEFVRTKLRTSSVREKCPRLSIRMHSSVAQLSQDLRFPQGKQVASMTRAGSCSWNPASICSRSHRK